MNRKDEYIDLLKEMDQTPKKVLDTKACGLLSKYLSVFYVSLGLGLRRFFVGGTILQKSILMRKMYERYI